ncbi:MAG: ferrous iron transport protein B [Anaerolineaceae bacterium]|nr:ferrous iron transport protein B [Anaerolineaceae bacterium]
MSEAAVNCHSTPESRTYSQSPVILVGNPNVGKSVVFGRLTRRYVTVSNYPGTTIEVAQGTLPDGTPVIDTPGINSLFSLSDDERVTTELILETYREAKALIQVADAKNLGRALLLTHQLTQLDTPMVLVVNMIDEAQSHGIIIRFNRLAEKLGIPVVPLVATQGRGVDELLAAIPQARHPRPFDPYEPALENAIHEIMALLPEDCPGARGLATHLLAGHPGLATQFSLNGHVGTSGEAAAQHYQRPLRSVLTMQQMTAAQNLFREVVTVPQQRVRGWRYRISDWAVHPIWGIPILLVVLFVVYKFVGEFGAGTLVDFMEGTVFQGWINPFVTRIVDAVLPIPLLRDLLVGEYGVVTMALTYGFALVLPIVTTFFFAFSILEDSGYLPRLASMLNRTFKMMGLNGKAVLPMILGLGCDTMATISTRILETRRERILTTFLLALGVPCSAQLGVILGMMGKLNALGVAIWGGVVAGTVLLVGWLAAKVLPGERSEFILELPPLRMPMLSNVAIKTVARIEWYLKEVLPLFIAGTLILFVVDKTGLLTVIEHFASPLIVGALGLPVAATGAFLIGFLRRDYGAAGLFALAVAGQLDGVQLVVSMVVITLFVPCIANVLVIFKEFGWRVTVGVLATVFPLAFGVGITLNLVLHALGVTL